MKSSSNEREKASIHFGEGGGGGPNIASHNFRATEWRTNMNGMLVFGLCQVLSWTYAKTLMRTASRSHNDFVNSSFSMNICGLC